MAALFEMVNNPAAYDAVYVPQDLGWFEIAISYRVQMIRHYDVGINGEASGPSGFIESIAGYDFDFIRTKDRKAVFGYSGDIESRCISRNSVHEA